MRGNTNCIGYFKKLESINFSIAIFVCFLAILSWIICGVFYGQTLMIGDVCEQTGLVLTGEMSDYPNYGEGFSYYFPCFSKLGTRSIGA